MTMILQETEATAAERVNMQLEIGQVYEGKVKSITQYGAFVEVAGGEVPHEALTIAQSLGIDSEWIDLARKELDESKQQTSTI